MLGHHPEACSVARHQCCDCLEPAMSELLLSVVSGFVDMSVPVPAVQGAREEFVPFFVLRGVGDVE